MKCRAFKGAIAHMALWIAVAAPDVLPGAIDGKLDEAVWQRAKKEALQASGTEPAEPTNKEAGPARHWRRPARN